MKKHPISTKGFQPACAARGGRCTPGPAGRHLARRLAGALLAGALCTPVAAVLAADPMPSEQAASTPRAAAPQAAHATDAKAWMERRQRWIAMRLEKDANRLEIKPSQQAAWNAYAEAVRGLMGRFAAHDAAPRARDAASLARRRADRAAAMAAGLSRVADATAALQKVLSPEQRTVFDQMAHRMGSHHHGHHRSGHPHGVHQQGDHHPGRPGWEGPEGWLDGQPRPGGWSGERHGG